VINKKVLFSNERNMLDILSVQEARAFPSLLKKLPTRKVREKVQ